MVRVLHVAVTLVVVLSGCAAVPVAEPQEPPQQRVSVTITNEYDERSIVRVSVVPVEADGFEVTYENGSTRRFDVSSFDDLPRAWSRNATAVETTDSSDRTREFTVEPTTGVGATFENAPANAAVVYFVLRDRSRDTVRGVGVSRCSSGTDTTDLDLVIRQDGSLHSSVTCGDGSG